MDGHVGRASDRLEGRDQPRSVGPAGRRDFAQPLIEAAPIVILILTPEGAIDFVNPYFERLTGYRLSEIRGKDWFDTFLPRRDRDRIRALFDGAIAATPTRGNVNPIVTRNGDEREIEWSDSVLRDDDGHIISLLAVGTDVTDKRRLEAEREQDHDRLRTILDGMFVFVGLYSLDGTLIEANRAPLELAGLGRADVIGKLFWDTYWWSYSEAAQDQVRTALHRAAAGEEVREDFRVRLGEDTFITIDAMFGPLRDPDGGIVGIVGSGVDITRRLMVEERLRQSELRLLEAQRIAQIGSWELDLTNDVLFWSDEIYRMFEIDPEQFGASYEAFLDAIHPDDRDMVNKAYSDSLINRTPYEITHRLRMADGRIKRVRERCETEFGADGKPLRSRGTVQDITDEWEAENALRKSQAMVSGILEISEEAIILADNSLRISLFSRGAQRVFGYDAEEAIGLDIHELIPRRFREPHHEYVRHFTTGPEKSIRMGSRGELAALRKNGEEFPATISLSRFESGIENHYSMIVRDIGPEKEAHVSLVTAKLAAEAANQAKSNFLANMSHELRTPLNAIIGFSEILKNEALGPLGRPDYRDYADDIHQAGKHLLDIINDILDLSKVESGEEVLNEERVGVPAFIEAVLRLVRHRAEKQEIKIELDVPSSLPMLRVDERKLKQILINLLSNAFKFTEPGGRVTVKTWCNLASGYVFQILDTGIGIATEDIPNALSPFGQVENAINRNFEGTGLGLPLTKSLVELHGGSLDLQSQVGSGTTVTVRFPASRIVLDEDVQLRA